MVFARASAAARALAIPEILSIVLSNIRKAIERAPSTSYSRSIRSLRKLAFVNRLWNKCATPILYLNLRQADLSQGSVKQLCRTLATSPHLAKQVRQLHLDGARDGCIALLVPVLWLEQLSIDLAGTSGKAQASLLRNVVIANNAASTMHTLTIIFHPINDLSAYEHVVSRLCRELHALRHLRLIDPDNIEQVCGAVVALPRPAGLLRLEIEDINTEIDPLLEQNPKLWEAFLPRLSNLKEMHIVGRAHIRVLDLLPPSLQRVSFGGCDGAFALEFIRRLAEPDGLPDLREPPVLRVVDIESLAGCYEQQDPLEFPSMNTVNRTTKNATEYLRQRNGWEITEELLRNLQITVDLHRAESQEEPVAINSDDDFVAGGDDDPIVVVVA